MAGVKISNLPGLINPSFAALLAVVDDGVTYKTPLASVLALIDSNFSCAFATTANLTATYDNGAYGVGATLTNATTLASLTIDGVSVSLADIILVKNQSSTLQNGIYFVANPGDGATAWVLERPGYYNESSEIKAGDCFTVAFGTLNAKTQWIQTSIVSTIGTDPITFESNIVAGFGITKTNNIISAIGNLSGSEITSATQAMLSNHRYIPNRGGGVAFSLPASSAVGDIISIVGKLGVWSITQGAGQQINIGASASTLGVGGSVTAAAATDSVNLVCIVANTIWTTCGAPMSTALVVV